MATIAEVRPHSELYQRMTSLAYKVELSQERMERIRRVASMEQLTAAAMVKPKRGPNRRLDYWREQVQKHGWPDGLESE